MANPGTLNQWINALAQDGRYSFSRAEAQAITDASGPAIEATLRRMKKKGTLVSPRRGFYVVVPPEYRSAGCPPATWFIDDLLQHLGHSYYVALLTAASLHGAGHQQPMAFQVIADTALRNIEVGRVRIEFYASNLVESAALQEMQTETGTMVVATPETTAFDLMRFPTASGSWSNIATVLGELAEKISPEGVAKGSARVARSDVQRLGWLLDFLGQKNSAAALAEVLSGKRLVPTSLSTTHETLGAPLDPRWRVFVNVDVEPDL